MPDSAPEIHSEPLAWPEGGVTRLPYRLCSDPEIYALEQKRTFRGPIWHFLCLELDIPAPAFPHLIRRRNSSSNMPKINAGM